MAAMPIVPLVGIVVVMTTIVMVTNVGDAIVLVVPVKILLVLDSMLTTEIRTER